MTRAQGARSVERSAIWALVPVVAMTPFTLVALFVFWLPIGLATDMPYWWAVAAFGAAGPLLFVRPFQDAVLTPVLGARPPNLHEGSRIAPAWSDIARANAIPADRYVLRVLPSDELNAFACGGHLMVVTSFAATELTDAELRGVLAHELSHHLGMHTVAITLGHWLSAPVVMLARIGFFFENVSTAAAQSFGLRSPLVEALGVLAAAVFNGAGWIFTAALRASDALANYVGHASEFEADQRAVEMGFGPELASALHAVIAAGAGARPIGWRGRLAATHPAALTRIARIDALVRDPARRNP